MYILILTVSYMYGVTATTAEFGSQKDCEAALVEYKVQMAERVETSSMKWVAFCTPKGHASWTR